MVTTSINLNNLALSSNIQCYSTALSPTTNYMIQSVNLPGIQLSNIDVNTKYGKIPFQSDVIEYEQLSFNVLVDEKLQVYLDLMNIAQQSQIPGTAENTLLNNDEEQLLHLLVFDNNNNKLFELQFHNILLDTIGNLEYQSNDNNSSLVLNIVIKYSYFKIIHE